MAIENDNSGKLRKEQKQLLSTLCKKKCEAYIHHFSMTCHRLCARNIDIGLLLW